MNRGGDKQKKCGRHAAIAGAFLTLFCFLSLASTAQAAIDEESQFVLNTFSFLIWGALVMWMCAGFTMLEAGSVRTKNVSVICLKNIGLYSVAGLTYYFIGYNLMYVEVGSWVGSLTFLYGPSADELALLSGQTEAQAAVVSNGYATMSDWFFQMVFVATAASIVSGTLAERVKLWSFLAFTTVLTAVIYPVIGAWTWGEGWLYQMGFQDFAGSTIVHSTGGWAALAGVIVVGPRIGKFRSDGSVKPTPPSNVPFVTLGVLILWFGWLGFNGGSQLALAGAADAVAMSNVLANTNLAASAGVVAALCVSRPLFGTGRSARRPERCDCRPRFDYRRTGYCRAVLGGHHRSDWRGGVSVRHEAAGEYEAGRRGRRDSSPSVGRYLGNAGGLYRGGRQYRRPDPRGARGRRVRLRDFMGSMAGAGKGIGGPGLIQRRRDRPGCHGTRHRRLPRVYSHA